ncbi:hypothetical protein CDD81_7820 [Ophiocordyceps australis]|uniref:Zn(2)-C6 fungal-type domain-containing protein n=1 Tax=Ophiocordyceps australis TaxID=1399860 RepID=A0A2C5YBY6_9HYPO|nr:hypothetical protein CDD81_7820 [Ophiocordyceps australis]
MGNSDFRRFGVAPLTSNFLGCPTPWDASSVSDIEFSPSDGRLNEMDMASQRSAHGSTTTTTATATVRGGEGSSSSSAGGTEGYVRSRIANACDLCKARKVRCDGGLPCSYCARRRQPGACRYSPQRRRRGRQGEEGGGQRAGAETTTVRRASRDEAAGEEEETEVPREARLLRDAQGRQVFVGDCAPLSFFQSVRRLVASRAGMRGVFAPEASRCSVLESGTTRRTSPLMRRGKRPRVRVEKVARACQGYRAMAAGLVDLFEGEGLAAQVTRWARAHDSETDDDDEAVVCHLVLAIGYLVHDDEAAPELFEYARDRALASALCDGSLLVGRSNTTAAQALVLATVYLLCACQLTGAWLLLGVAVRAAYALGLHRGEVNARFGVDGARSRDRLWKSLRVLDLLLSIAMGRPPATSDLDCTVPYASPPAAAAAPELDESRLLDASVQILLVAETIVVEIYSRRRVSLALTEGISRQLRHWAAQWMAPLKSLLSAPASASSVPRVIGACQVMASYYYAVMLVARPFLMYDVCRRLDQGEGAAESGHRSRLANACIDAATLMVDMVLDLIDRGVLHSRVPLVVSWLFAASLVLGLGLLADFGRRLEHHTRAAIRALNHLSATDGDDAAQYSLIAQSLLAAAQAHIEAREAEERRRRTESSSQLFGMLPAPPPAATPARLSPSSAHAAPPEGQAAAPQTLLDDLLPDNGWMDWVGAEAMNLFPLLETGAEVDLANYL